MVRKTGQKLETVVDTSNTALQGQGTDEKKTNDQTSSIPLFGSWLNFQIPDLTKPQRINLQLFGLQIPINLEGPPDISDPTKDSEHRGDPVWVEALVQTAEKKHQEALQMKERAKTVERQKGEPWDMIDRIAIDGEVPAVPQKDVRGFETLVSDPAQDQLHLYDTLWVPALNFYADKKEKEALELLNRAKALIHSQGGTGNLSLHYQFGDRVEILERGLLPNPDPSNNVDDPAKDSEYTGNDRIKNLIEAAEKAYGQGDYEKALSYLKRAVTLADKGITSKTYWYSSQFPGENADQAYERCKNSFFKLRDQATALETKIHTAWHGLADRISTLQTQIDKETDPKKLQELNGEIEWLKRGERDLAELDKIRAKSLPPQYKAQVRQALAEAYLRRDEAAVRKLTERETEEIKDAKIVGDDAAGYQLVIEKAGEAPVIYQVVNKEIESQIVAASMRGVEGKLAIARVNTKEGRIEIRRFVGADGSQAFQKIVENYGDLETLRKVAEAEEAQEFLFNHTVNEFTDYFAFTGVTFDFSNSNSLNAMRTINEIMGYASTAHQFEMPFNKAQDLALAKEYAHLRHEEVSLPEEINSEGKLFLKIWPTGKQPENWRILEKKGEREETTKRDGDEGTEKIQTYRTDRGTIEIHRFSPKNGGAIVTWKVEKERVEAIERSRAFIFSNETLKAHIQSIRVPPHIPSMENRFSFPVDPATGLAGVRATIKQLKTDLPLYQQFIQSTQKTQKEEKMKTAQAESIAFDSTKQEAERALGGYVDASQREVKAKDANQGEFDIEAAKNNLKQHVKGFYEREKIEFDSHKAQYLARYAEDRNVLKTDEEWNEALARDPKPMPTADSHEVNAHPDAAVDPQTAAPGNPVEMNTATSISDGGVVMYDMDWEALRKQYFNLNDSSFGIHPQLKSIEDRIAKAKTPEEVAALYGELKALYANEIDVSATYLHDMSVPVYNDGMLGQNGVLQKYFLQTQSLLKGEGMEADADRVKQFEEEFKLVQNEKDPEKKLFLFRQWREGVDFYIWKLVMKGERKMADQLKSTGFKRDVAEGGRDVGHYLTFGWIDQKDYDAIIEKTFDPYIQKMDSAIADFEKGEILLDRARSAQERGEKELAEQLYHEGRQNIQKAWSTYHSLRNSTARAIVIDEGKDMAVASGLVIGIAIVAIAALTAGYATPLLVPEAGFLATTAVSAGVFTLTHEVLNSAVYDETFILDPDRWNSGKEIAGNLLHLGGKFVENFGMFLFVGKLMEMPFAAVVRRGLIPSAEKLAIEAGEVIKVGEELVPLAKGQFNLLSKEVSELYVNAAAKNLHWAKKVGLWTAREVKNYLALNAWTLVSSPFTGHGLDLSAQGQGQIVMFLGGLIPANLLSGKLMQATLVPHLSKKFGDKLQREWEPIKKEAGDLNLEQIKLTRDGLKRIGLTEEAKYCDTLLEWYGKERKDTEAPPADLKIDDVQGLNLILLQRVSKDMLKEPEWAHWMEQTARLQVRWGEHAKKQSDFFEKNPSAFSGTEKGAFDASHRNHAKALALYGEQTRPFYERTARMIEAHREFFGKDKNYDPFENLKRPYREGGGSKLIDALPDLIGADAQHQVFLSVKDNGVVNIILVGLDKEGGLFQQSFNITPKEKITPQEVAQMRRHVERAQKKNPHVVSKLVVDVNDVVINVGENGRAQAKKEPSMVDPHPTPPRPSESDYQTLPPPPPPPPPSPSVDTYRRYQVDSDLARQYSDSKIPEGA